jgi:molybdopterin molybdotransferase
VSLVDAPAVDTAAMDGYAVAGPGPWDLLGTAPARLAPGTAVEIATGARVPPGVLGVVPYEAARVEGPRRYGACAAGQHVRRRGEDHAAGTELLPAGWILTPPAIGLAAGAGHDALRVHRRPAVAALITGDELLLRGRPGRGKVRDAVGPMLPGIVGAAGGSLAAAVHLPDEAGRLAEAIRTAPADVIVTSGASSAGPADHLRPVLHALGADLLVEGVSCRPGHPQVLAALPRGRYLVGLPGNPHAAFVAALTLLVPLLAALSGRPRPGTEQAVLLGDLRSHPELTRLVAVRTEGAEATPVGHDRPAQLWGAALADALAVVPPGWAGGPVPVVRLRG